MRARCQICLNENVLQINREIARGVPLAKIAKFYSVPYNSLFKHRHQHLPRQIVQAFDKKESGQSDALLNTISEILEKARIVFDRNFAEGKDTVALRALENQKGTIALLASISHDLQQAKLFEQGQQGSSGMDEEQKESLQKGLRALSFQELTVLKKLALKINAASKQEVLVEPLFSFDDPLSPFEEQATPNLPKRADKSAKNGLYSQANNNEPSELSVRPILPEEIPTTRVKRRRRNAN